ncbi:hypothetical protein [Aquisediminimonas sediminicola]|uniref:hypothetical protein n=1 Tax=Alteraquisediminimonas sediminicola TaxID=2676787 RepID=UPI001C8DEC8A|nr:hypothetical protein [Aquisediminimonas sediminicola]
MIYDPNDPATAEDCPLCTGDYSDDFVEMIKAAALNVSPSMSADEMKAWLTQLDETLPHR